jgi:hypothetical protein
MLTSEEIEARAWCGMSTLRRVLGDKRAAFENSLYPTSISSSEFDLISCIALIGALTSAHRTVLGEAIKAQPAGPERELLARGIYSDLGHLSGALRSFAARLDEIGKAVGSLQTDVIRVVGE